MIFLAIQRFLGISLGCLRFCQNFLIFRILPSFLEIFGIHHKSVQDFWSDVPLSLNIMSSRFSQVSRFLLVTSKWLSKVFSRASPKGRTSRQSTNSIIIPVFHLLQFFTGQITSESKKTGSHYLTITFHLLSIWWINQQGNQWINESTHQIAYHG